LKTWKIVLIPTLITVVIAGIYLFSVWRHRQDPGAIGRQAAADQPRSLDDVAVVRILSPAHYDDVLPLQGASVWMKNGYTMPYFPFAGAQVNFAKQAGVVPSIQRLDVKKIVKQAVPATLYDSMGHGTRQVFAVFTMAGATDEFATPIGVIDGEDEQYYTDALFFYDAPHKIYDNWPKDVWAAVDAHQVKQGMNELQTRLAIGQAMHPDSQNEGDRTVTYDQAGKHWTVTFVNDRATAIKSE